MTIQSCVFSSQFGYSSLLRIGKIYNLTISHYKYLLETYEDLIDHRYIFRRFFTQCRENMKVRIFKFLLSASDMKMRELGCITTKRMMEKYYMMYFRLKKGESIHK